MIRLSELRKEKNLSQRQMAERFNVSQGTYCNWEKGTTEPSIEQLIEMSKFFGVSVDYLIGNTDEEGNIVLSREPASDLHTLYGLEPESRNLVINLINKLKER